jgi:hypothetical protein
MSSFPVIPMPNRARRRFSPISHLRGELGDPYPRRRFSPISPLRGLGDSGGAPYTPDIGPAILAPFNVPQGAGVDPIEALTQMDEGTYQDPGQGQGTSNRPNLPPWIYPPTNWENIDQDNYVLVPAIGSTVVIISYVVPPGRNGVINKVANNFVGGGWVEGTGDIVWRILVDGTPPPGATSYDSILASLGNPASPTGVAGFRIFENQLLTLVAFNNPAGANGGVVVAGQRVGARFCGWNYPTDIEEADIWI